MKRMALTVALLVFLSAFIATIGILPEVRATTLYVGGGDPGNYTTIQAAVDNASSGDLVFVYAGTYLENVVVDKPLSIIGEDKGTTIIDGNASGDVIRITADWVNVTGVKVANGGISGFKLEYVQYCRIWDNLVQGNDIGIHVYYSDDNTIEDNNASLNNYFGISLAVAYRNAISNNTVSNHLLTGIGLSASVSNTVAGNSVYLNEYGVVLTNSHFNTVLNNTFYDNDKGLRLVTVSQNNTVYHNNFTDNTEQALDEVGWNDWDNGYPSGGNYWNDYAGIDQKSGPNQNEAGSDGIGDTPYDISGGASKDRYPFMKPMLEFNNPPTASFTVTPLEGNTTTIFIVDASTSSDPEDPTISLEFKWDCENDGAWDSFFMTSQCQYSTPGTYTVRLEVRDTWGRTNITTRQVIVRPIENQQPTCSISEPEQGDVLSENYTVIGTASDSDGVVEEVEIRIDGGPWIQVTGTSSWSYEWNTTDVSDGDHTIYARSYDGTDYSEEVSVTVVVDNVIPPPPVGEESIFEQAWFWMTVAVVIVIILLAVFILIRRRKEKQGEGESPESG